MTTRRDFLKGSVAAGALGLVPGPRRLPPLPRVNEGINIQPLRRMDTVSDFTPPLVRTELVALQLREIYRLGFRSIRLTASFNEFGPDFFGTIPYVRAARALGVDVLVILDQFGHGFDLLRALARPDRRHRVLEAYHGTFVGPVAPASPQIPRVGRVAFQVLNEPTESRGLRPSDYVRSFLAPVRRDLASIDPELRVLSAAPVGRRAGLWRLREMLVAGVEQHCDRVAIHVYNADLIGDLSDLVRAPVEITETGVAGVARHLGWHRDVYERIRAGISGVEEIHWFDLFDFQPDGFRLIDLHTTGEGFASTVESHDLYARLIDRVRQATRGREHASFEALIPDLGPYLPTAEDFARVEAAR